MCIALWDSLLRFVRVCSSVTSQTFILFLRFIHRRWTPPTHCLCLFLSLSNLRASPPLEPHFLFSSPSNLSHSCLCSSPVSSLALSMIFPGLFIYYSDSLFKYIFTLWYTSLPFYWFAIWEFFNLWYTSLPSPFAWQTEELMRELPPMLRHTLAVLMNKRLFAQARRVKSRDCDAWAKMIDDAGAPRDLLIWFNSSRLSRSHFTDKVPVLGL